ncbi:MAG: RNA polymerase sporulation sigma factor SigK [Oscillospiraceae bacterium]|jgi:RNA polymerase sporulation-specific sigma factor
MLTALFGGILSGILFLVLHVTGNGTFPRALSYAEEQDCLKRMAQGDPSARQKLIEHNLRLVAHIIKKYYSSSADQDDLISIGTIGLIKAINTFKPEKGIKLSSYAARCVENEILMYFRSLRKTAQDISMNEPIDSDKDGGQLTLCDVMASDRSIAEDLDGKMQSEQLHAYIKKALTPREQTIVCLRYGLQNHKPLTQREVAKRLGISRSYVSRIEKKALEKLKSRFEEVGIKS